MFITSVTLTVFRHVALASMLLVAPRVYAECTGLEYMTAAEKDFYVRADAALKSFLPPKPQAEDIRVFGKDETRDPKSINWCAGKKVAGGFNVWVHREYIWPDIKKFGADAVVLLTLTINAKSFGDGKANGNVDGRFAGAYGTPSPRLSEGLTVRNVVWEVAAGGVEAQKNALRDAVAAVLDNKRLEALVGHPLPSVAESEANAKKVPAPAVMAPKPAAAAPAVAPASAPPPSAPASTPTTMATQPPLASEPAPTGTIAPPAATTDQGEGVADTVTRLRGILRRKRAGLSRALDERDQPQASATAWRR